MLPPEQAERKREYERERAKRPDQKARKKEWADAHPEYGEEYGKRWRAANPDAVHGYNRAYRAQQAAAEGSHTAEEVAQMYRDQDGLCAYCEAELEGVFHVEHMVPLSRSGDDGWWNIALACPPCNLGKGRRTAEEFVNA
ncbi:HNH endonuclease [Rubrobacter marinus]|uniref:HNH endonuclease n=1 Tax=Rubrobacter marinus TaxID=2653852 RepID=UPI00140CBF29|nr:HNH endonuclease [Rubrobacter marinus]